jgi:hypothetical protein
MDQSKTLIEQEDDQELDYHDEQPLIEEEEVPVVVASQSSKVDTLVSDMAGVKRDLQELIDSFKKSGESSKEKKQRLGRTPSPVPKKVSSNVVPSDDTPPSSPPRAESSTSVFRSALSLVASRKRTSDSLVDVSGSPTRPGEQPRSSLPAFPLHHLVKDWYSLASAKLDDPAVKSGTPFEPSFLKASDKMFGRLGPDFKALAKPREFPPRFHEISTLKGQEQVKTKTFAPRTSSQAHVKSLDRLARVGVAASSYSHHLIAATRMELADCRAIEGESSRLSNRLDAMDSYLDAAEFVARDVSGIFVTQDVNQTLQRRDVLLGTLDQTYSRHSTALRSADLLNLDVLPGVESVLNDSGADVTRALLKRVAQTPDGRPARESYKSNKKPFQQDRGRSDQSSRYQSDSSWRFADSRRDDRRDDYRPRGRGRGRGDNRPRGQSSYNNDDRRQQPQQRQQQQQQQRGCK